MKQVGSKLPAILAAVFAALVLAACSGDDPGLLPGDDAQQILANLERVEELASNGECAAALESIETISAQITALPNSVSDRLRQNLRRGVVRLSEVTASSCGEPPAESEATTDTTTEPEEETVPEEEEETGPTGETGEGATGPDTGEGSGEAGRGGRRPGDGSRGEEGAGGGPNQQPETDPGTGGETGAGTGGGASGGISPEEQTEGEAGP